MLQKKGNDDESGGWPRMAARGPVGPEYGRGCGSLMQKRPIKPHRIFFWSAATACCGSRSRPLPPGGNPRLCVLITRPPRSSMARSRMPCRATARSSVCRRVGGEARRAGKQRGRDGTQAGAAEDAAKRKQMSPPRAADAALCGPIFSPLQGDSSTSGILAGLAGKETSPFGLPQSERREADAYTHQKMASDAYVGDFSPS